MAKRVLSALREIKWWEYLFIFLYFATTISLGIIFKSSALIILNTFFPVTTVFLLAKGMVVGNFVGIINIAIYSINCYFNGFYGEIICGLVIVLPSYCLSIYTWLKTMKKGSTVLSINRGLSKKEWILIVCTLCVLSVGVYFLLKAFNTAYLVVSTIATMCGMLSGYLSIRRCEFNFLMYAVSNMITIVLWCLSIMQNSLVNLPILVAFCVQFLLNCFGLLNWIRIKRLQSKEDNFDVILKICKNS